MMHAEAQKFNLCLKVTDSGFALFTTKGLSEGDTICDMTCLWYTTIEKLKHVLSQEGNKAMLDKLVTVDGLYKEGVASKLFGIRVGAAAWVRHYLGVRKGGPNAKVVIKSAAGFTAGLAQLVVSTRNGLGISQDTEICMNYGPDYDFGILQEVTESPCKKFKGALETLFYNQDGENSKKEDPKNDDKEDADEEPKKKKLKKEDPKKEGTEGAKTEDSEDSTIIAKDVTADGFTLRFQDNNLSLHAKTVSPGSQPAGNKKVPPGTLLYLIRDGGMKRADALGGVLYHLDLKTSVMIAPDPSGGPMGLGGKPLALAEVVDKLKIQIIAEVPEFVVAGQLPAKITISSKYWFIPKDWRFVIITFVLF